MVPSTGVSLEEAEAALDETLADFIETGVDPEQLERIKFQLRADRIYARDNVQSLSRRYGSALTSGLTVEDVQAWPEVLQSITPEEIVEAAKKVFDRKQSVTGYLMAEETATPMKEVTQ